MNWMLILLQTVPDAADKGSGGDSSSVFANFLLIAGVALLIFVLWFNVRKRVAGHESLDPREKIERDKQVSGMKNDMRAMMVELDELTRRFSSQLDAKSVKLERLIEQADQRIAKLNGQSVDVDRSDAAERSREAASGQVEIETTVGSPDPLAENIYQLADAGKDPGEIARQLDEHIGKVELILALRQQA
jgi:hypothetical protein